MGEKREGGFFDILSWCSMVVIIIAYGLLSFGYLKQTDVAYHAMNLFGALGLGIDCFRKGALAPMMLNIFFIVIAVMSIVRFSMTLHFLF